MRFGRTNAGTAVALLSLALMGLGLPRPSVAADARKVEIEDVRVGFSERFKLGSWTPVRVQVRSTGAEPFDGFLEIAAADEDATPSRSRWPLRVAAGDTARVTAYIRPGSRNPNIGFRFVTTDGQTVGQSTLEGVRAGGSEPTPLMPDDVLLLSLGRAQRVEEISQLPGMTVTRQGQTREVSVARIGGADADLLPGRPQGYDAVDTLVVDTNDKELMAALRTRGDALVEWVARGGHAVVAVGVNWQSVTDSPLAPILPVKLNAPVRVTDLRALESFAQASAQITESNQPAQVVKMDGIEARSAKILSSTASTPLIVRGVYGFGRVTVVALDVDAPPFSAWTDAKLFWVKTLDLVGGGAAGGTRTTGRLVQSGASDLSTVLRTSLDLFPGVKMVPFGWVAFLIFLYILMIGPFDYLFLKKVVKRMEFTWITFPLIVVAVSIGAAYAAYKMKGTELRMNQVDVVDLDQNSGRIRGTSILNLFSPSNQDYQVSVKPLLAASGPATPLSSADTRLSWFGASDNGLRGTTGTARGMSFGNEGYLAAPPGGAEKIESLRIPIWSTKALSANWFANHTAVAIESDLQQVGPDRLAGTITNRLDTPLKDVIVAFGTQVYYGITEIAPGATTRVELALNRQLSGYLADLRTSYIPKSDVGPLVTINRPNLLRALMFSGSENTAAEPLNNLALKSLDLTGQLRLDRPMLVAQVEKPLATVTIGPEGSAPKTERTTILRVILPLDRGQAASGSAIPR